MKLKNKSIRQQQQTDAPLQNNILILMQLLVKNRQQLLLGNSAPTSWPVHGDNNELF